MTHDNPTRDRLDRTGPHHPGLTSGCRNNERDVAIYNQTGHTVVVTDLAPRQTPWDISIEPHRFKEIGFEGCQDWHREVRYVEGPLIGTIEQEICAGENQIFVSRVGVRVDHY